jgi:Domain of unknown function (DUF4178)
MEFLLLALAATVSVTSLLLWSKARRAEDTETKTLALPAVDRTPLTAQVGDIVEHLDRDWLVEGAIAFSESPRAARLCRLIDGAEERFLYAREHEQEAVWLLAPIDLTPDRAEELIHDGEPLRLERRWHATVLTAGRLGRRVLEPELTVYEYTAPTGRFLLALDGATRATAFFGERLLPHALEILPGRG